DLAGIDLFLLAEEADGAQRGADGAEEIAVARAPAHFEERLFRQLRPGGAALVAARAFAREGERQGGVAAGGPGARGILRSGRAPSDAPARETAPWADASRTTSVQTRETPHSRTAAEPRQQPRPFEPPDEPSYYPSLPFIPDLPLIPTSPLIGCSGASPNDC